MKITYVHQHFKRPDEAGGSRPWEFARRLAADGHEVLMISGGAQRRNYSEAGFRVCELPIAYENAMGFRRRLLAFARFSFQSTIVVLRNDADVNLASSTPLTVGFPVLLSKWLTRTPFVFEVRDLWPEIPIALGIVRQPILKWASTAFARTLYRQAARIIALSPGMAHGVMVASGREAVVIPNAADFDRFHHDRSLRTSLQEKLGVPSGTYLVYAGSFGQTYDLQGIVRMVPELQRNDVTVTLFGEGTDSADLRSLATALGVDAERLLPGRVDKTTAASHVAAADAVLSSIVDVEAFHANSFNKVFDAMAAGTPVIFTHGGWLSGLVCDAGGGIRVDTSDTAQSVRAVLDFVKSPTAVQTAGVAVHNLGLAHFDRDELYPEFLSVLESTLAV